MGVNIPEWYGALSNKDAGRSWVQLRSSIAPVVTVLADSNGTFLVTNIPVGTYSLWTGGSQIGPWTQIDATYVISSAFTQTVHSQQNVSEVLLVSGVDPLAGETVFVTLTANRVVGAPQNAAAGERLKFVFTQNGTGGWTLTFNAAFSVTNWTVNTAANARTTMEVEYDAVASKWVVASNPASLKTSEGRYNLVVDYAADPTGVADSAPACQTATAAVPSSVGGIIYAPPGNYLCNSSPFKVYRKTDTLPSIAPSIIGAGSGADKFAGHQAATKFTASGSFPVGEFFIDYIGTQTTTFAALCGYKIGGFALEGSGRGAGIRHVNHMSTRHFDIVMNETATPAPADATGTPTGAMNLLIGANDYSYQNSLDQVYIIAPANDGFCLTQTRASKVFGSFCSSIGAVHYNYNAGDATYLFGCDAQSAAAGGSDYYINGATMVNCTEQTFGSHGNSLVVDNVSGNNNRDSLFIGCQFTGAPSGAQSEQNAALIRIKWIQARVIFSGCSFEAGTNTSDWVYMDTGPSTHFTIFDGCQFNQNYLPVTNKFNLNGNTKVRFTNCPGINPLAGVTTPGFPLTTVAVTNNTAVDVMAYITNGTSALTVQVDTDTALMVIPASQTGSVLIPAGSTFTPTYGGGAPTWKWKGN